jgi:hypothetical protein
MNSCPYLKLTLNKLLKSLPTYILYNKYYNKRIVLLNDLTIDILSESNTISISITNLYNTTFVPRVFIRIPHEILNIKNSIETIFNLIKVIIKKISKFKYTIALDDIRMQNTFCILLVFQEPHILQVSTELLFNFKYQDLNNMRQALPAFTEKLFNIPIQAAENYCSLIIKISSNSINFKPIPTQTHICIRIDKDFKCYKLNNYNVILPLLKPLLINNILISPKETLILISEFLEGLKKVNLIELHLQLKAI